MNRLMCIVLHDVAPCTRRECEALLDMLAALGSPPVTLLVVPNFHGRKFIVHDSALRRTIDRWVNHGSEVALHGLLHRDDLRQQGSRRAWLVRRLMTAGEGEFSVLSAAEATARIACGQEMLERCGWSPEGFVPPAWLASSGTREALARSRYTYTSSHTALISLPQGARIFSPCLTATWRSPWRRWTSRMFLRIGPPMFRRFPLIRAGLHPADARDPVMLLRWRNVLRQLMSEREAVTKGFALRH